MKQAILRTLQKINSFISHIVALGFKDGVKIFFLNTKREGVIEVSLKTVKSPIYIRGNTSDFSVLQQIFYAKDYEISLPGTPKVIVDCGANIGLASVFFKNRFPASKIIAVEPEASNFELVKKNTAPYTDIACEKAGIWKSNAYLEILEGPTKTNWDFIVNETDAANPKAIKGITIPFIMEKYNIKEIDVLKIDIEGSEKELFEEGYEMWLPKVKVLLIELHDRMKLGCGQAFFRAISKYDFDFSHSGENIIAIRRNAGL